MPSCEKCGRSQLLGGLCRYQIQAMMRLSELYPDPDAVAGGVDVEVDANYHRMADIDVAQQALLEALYDDDLVDGLDAAEVAGQDAFFAERVVI